MAGIQIARLSILFLALWSVNAFSVIQSGTIASKIRKQSLRSFNSWNDDDAQDPNTWISSTWDKEEEWDTTLRQRKDDSYWSVETSSSTAGTPPIEDEAEDEELLLDIVASQGAAEVSFNAREAERAYKVRQMEEWGFDRDTIASALDVAVEETAEESVQTFWEESYDDVDDPLEVESHAKVPRDPDTNEPLRSQMVYVDEHTCIGCTNCAMIAQSTFFMEEENGRARVFEQWGDDEATIQTAIDTCPVDCIHYVPYPELVRLEVQRRDQHINVLAGLVSRAERGAGSGLMSSTPRSFGNKRFTGAPRVSRNYYDNEDARLELERQEKLRLFKDKRRMLEEERRRDNKVVDL